MKFFRFNAGLAAILIAVAFAFRPPDVDRPRPARVALVALVVAEAAIVLYWATVGRDARVDPSGDRRASRVGGGAGRAGRCRRSPSRRRGAAGRRR